MSGGGLPSSKTRLVAAGSSTAAAATFADVVDMERLDPLLPGADHRHDRQVLHERHELVHAAVVRAVDPGRAQDDVLHAAGRDGALGALLGPEPGLGPARPGAGAAQVDEPLDAVLRGGGGHPLGAGAVDPLVGPAPRGFSTGWFGNWTAWTTTSTSRVAASSEAGSVTSPRTYSTPGFGRARAGSRVMTRTCDGRPSPAARRRCASR